MVTKNTEIPDGLFEKVMSKIYIERERQIARRKFFISSVSGLISIIAIFPVGISFYKAIINSGFYQFFELFLIDTRSVIANWEDYTLSLLETFPSLNATILLIAVLTTLFSLKIILKNFNSVRRLKPIAR